MPDSSYTDAGSLKALFDHLLRPHNIPEIALEALLYSLATRKRALPVPPPWRLYLTEAGELVLETAGGRCNLDEVCVKVWSHHPPYGKNLTEYLEPRHTNRKFDMARADLVSDMREYNIVVDEPYPKLDGMAPLADRIYRTMNGTVVEGPYGELIPAERFAIRVPTDAERAALRNGDKEARNIKGKHKTPAEKLFDASGIVTAVDAYAKKHKGSRQTDAFKALYREHGHASANAMRKAFYSARKLLGVT